MRVKFKYKIIVWAVAIFVIRYAYKFLTKNEQLYLSPPSSDHWFGTDITGDDIFLKSFNALGIEVATLIIVLAIIFLAGYFIGTLLSYFSGERLREFFLNIIHFWVTLPILLIALFLLILIKAGQINAIIVMVFVMIPTQALYVYNQIESVKQNDFIVAKMSYGLTKSSIYIHHLMPTIRKGFTNYTLARMPEILMLNLALNFLGLGVQPPYNSFGRMLFDGLSFMFSAWWTWIFVVGLVILLFKTVYKFTYILDKILQVN